ncbi:hypothetical protein FGG08_006412 [Glutinoglossum americanum]|uniref:AMP-activated protein kinase glycogen-binding domain-containing protein n=1 Tax=Glutinoglossum americanum TaxID=1670608 RepID=A0A9P8I7F1_9PEZI|nr:hypothetical protein FGG08_006412 [Glutinoglossum americanum]
MGSYTFKWEGPTANEVIVTGTFDDWKKTVRLEKKGDIFEKCVELPPDQRVLYKASQRNLSVLPVGTEIKTRLVMKYLPPRLPASLKALIYLIDLGFIVDGDWKADPNAPEFTGEDGITNNVLPPEKIIKTDSSMNHVDPGAVVMSTVTPSSTTAELAKDVPLEKNARGDTAPHDPTISSAAPESSTANLAKDVLPEGNRASSTLPGTFPETPQREPSDFSVKPLPATDGPGNPIHLKPGEKVPDSSSLTANTIQSTVHDDEELKAKSEDPQQVFSVNPLPATAGVGNPIHLRPGEPVPDPSTFTNNTTTSTVTTDKESFDKSGSTLPSLSVLPPVVTPQYTANGTGVLDVPPISENMIPESSLPMGGDTTAFETDPGVTISSVDPTSTTAALAAKVPLEPKHATSEAPEAGKESQKEAGTPAEASASVNAVKDDEVPETVKESIAKAHVDPEATTNPEAVHEKKEAEAELLQSIKREEGTGEPPPAAKSADRPITPKSPERPESRDVSPMSKPTTAAHTGPTATPGVTETSADKVAEPPQTPAAPKNAGVKAEAAESSKPSTDSPTSHPTDKKKKRFSWLGKVKEKLHLDKDKEKK